MALSLDDDSRILDNGIPLKFLRDAEYDWASPLVAFDYDTDPLNPVQTLLQTTSDGRLKVDSTVSIPNINIGAVEIEDRTGGPTLRLDVAPIGGTSTVGVDNDHGILSMGVDDNGLVQALPIRDLGGGDFAVAVDIQDAELTINTDGQQLTLYGEQLSVSQGDGEVTVVSRTVPAGKRFFVRHISVSGENVAVWQAKIDGTTKAKKRTYFTGYDGDFFFGGDMSQGMLASAGEVVTVTVFHSRSSSADFNATIHGREEDV